MSDVIRIHGGPRQAEALDNLVGLIEAGSLKLQDLGVNSRAFPVEIFDGEAMTLHTVIAAFNGSFDAAFALKEALLPGWRVSLRQEMDILGSDDLFRATVAPMDATRQEHVFRPTAVHAKPGRALLLAHLRAFRGTLA